MQPSACLLVSLASTIFAQSCHVGQKYCGDWLMEVHNYSEATLWDAVELNPSVPAPLRDRIQDGLFQCDTTRGEVKYVEYCWNHCQEIGRDGWSDSCRPPDKK
ncbi:hypothetical protein ASPZODRAFT_132653, partial [Penicilliopsis zonata CBS 506.65]